MNKKLCVILIVLLCLLTAGCTKKEEPVTYPDWDLEGYFLDEDGNFVSVTPSPYEEYPGWYVGCMIGEDMYGWVIQQEKDTLHGNIVPEYEEGEYIVTVSREGEDGIAFAVEGGETYHLKKLDDSELVAKYSLRINIEGDGEIAYAQNGNEIEFEEGYPYQSAQINVKDVETVRIAARASEGWKFVKWTRNGTDYSTEAVLDIEVNEDIDMVAVFEAE